MNDKERRKEDGAEKKRHPFRGVLVFLLIALTVFVVVAFAAYRDGTGFDVLSRYFSYGKAEEAGGAVVYDYDADSSNRFAVLGEYLLVLSETNLALLDDQGGEVLSRSVKMSAPAIHVGGGRAVAYDVGGTELYVADSEGTVQTLSPVELPGALISATVNEKGWLAVTTEMKNKKGCVTVFDDGLEPRFAFRSSNRFVLDGYVTDDCKSLAAVTLGQEESTFVSNILLYDLTEQEPYADYDVADGLVVSIGQSGSGIVTVSDTVLTIGETDGTIKASYPYGGAYLREYTMEGDGFTALLLNRYSSGSVGRIVTIGEDGKELGALDVNEEVVNLSAAGRYLAVLYASRLVIYNPDLQVYATLSGTDYARCVLVRPDGSALLAGSESAELFLP